MKIIVIETNCFGIKVTLTPTEGDMVSGVIESDLHARNGGEEEEPEYKAAIDAIESLVLAHAVAGIDITLPAYLEGIETAIEAIDNNI